MNIGNLHFENGIFLSPMAGVTEVGFRKVCEMCGAEMCVSEMVSAQALFYKNTKTQNLLLIPENAKYKAVQIFGHQPEIMGKIAAELSSKFDLIDINMGCPAPKIFKNGDGSALMKDLDLASKIIKACVQASKVPITVKFRSGINENNINAVEFAKMCEAAGASAITIHARTREQFYSGNADYSLIKKVVNAVSIPVIANGDVTDISSYNKILSTGCAGVMIGRGALGNPQIFNEILSTHSSYTKDELVKIHLNELEKHFDENFISKHMRKHLLWYSKGLTNAKEAKENAIKVQSIEDIHNFIDKYLT